MTSPDPVSPTDPAGRTGPGNEARPRRFDWRDDRGQFAGIEALPFGVLVFVLGALLVTNAWAVVDAKMAVSSAAREAARTYVEAPDLTAAQHRSQQAGLDAIAGQGRDPDQATVTVTNPAGALTRCVRITATATYQLPAVGIPVIGGYGRGFRVEAHHSELIDPLRAGLDGTSCG